MTEKDGAFEWYLAYYGEKTHVFLLIVFLLFLTFVMFFWTISLEGENSSFLEILVQTMKGGEDYDFN